MADENVSFETPKSNDSEQAKEILVNLLDTLQNRHSKIEEEFQNIEIQAHDMLNEAAKRLGWEDVEWYPMPNSEPEEIESLQAEKGNGGQAERIEEMEQTIRVKDVHIFELKKQLEELKQKLNTAKGLTPAGGIMVPSGDVEDLVGKGLIFHFQKLQLVQCLLLMWAQDTGICPHPDMESDIFEAAAEIIQDACRAYDRCTEGLNELHEKAKGDTPKSSTEGVLKAVSEAETTGLEEDEEEPEYYQTALEVIENQKKSIKLLEEKNALLQAENDDLKAAAAE